MFTIIGWCLTHKTQVRTSKVKVSLGESVLQIRVWSVTSTCMEGFKYNLGQMFAIARRECSAKNSSVCGKGQGHIFAS
jgi:hypothetical protein